MNKMMHKKLFTIIALSWMLIGCSSGQAVPLADLQPAPTVVPLFSPANTTSTLLASELAEAKCIHE